MVAAEAMRDVYQTKNNMGSGMTSELMMLLWAAASIAFIHTILGPDHYLPFVAIGKARGWSLPRTAVTTALCGVGHSVGSIILGVIGVYAGHALSDLQIIEGFRGDVAAWGLIVFGLIYMVWGLQKSRHHKTHSHMHGHADGIFHSHNHNHAAAHAHVHEAGAEKKIFGIFTPWALFIIFVLGPCEPLIPLMMVPAAQGAWFGMAMTVGIFMLVTIATMTTIVVAASLGLKTVSFAGLEKYTHAFAGGTLSLCGLGIITLGL